MMYRAWLKKTKEERMGLNDRRGGARGRGRGRDMARVRLRDRVRDRVSDRVRDRDRDRATAGCVPDDHPLALL